MPKPLSDTSLLEITNVTVLPAAPGTFAVFDTESAAELYAKEPVLAWRVETVLMKEGTLSSNIEPLTIDGDVPSNCVGVLHPDGRVSLFVDTVCDSLAEATKRVRSTGKRWI